MAAPVLLLDLGGVLADLGDPVASLGLAMNSDEFWRTWLTSSAVRALETGRIGTDEFFGAISAELGYEGDEPFGRRFHRWRLQPFPSIDELIRREGAGRRVALLSNTNEIHWRQVCEATDVFATFERTFLSFETGLYKPSPDAFMQVIDFFACPPGDIRFLDDSRANVDAAVALGIDAHCYIPR